MNSIAFVVTTSPTDNLTRTAIRFIEAAAKSKCIIQGVFFYQLGVLNASSYIAIPSDEYQVIEAWKEINNKYNVPLYLCSTAAEKLGLRDELSLEESDNSNLSTNISPEFTVSGLSELVTLTQAATRIVQL